MTRQRPFRLRDIDVNWTDVANMHLKPAAHVRVVNLWKGTLFANEYTTIMGIIGYRGYLEDAIKLLSEEKTARSQITYELVSSVLKRRIELQVVNTQFNGPSPHGYIGHIVTYNKDGREVRQCTLEDIFLMKKD